MNTYSGGITVKTFPNNIKGYVSEFNQTIKDIADHTHQGSGAGSKIHGTTAIQPGTIQDTAFTAGTITSAKFVGGTVPTYISNDVYIKWRNAANSADLNTIKVDTADLLELEKDIAVLRLANTVVLQGSSSAGGAINLLGVNSSDQWEIYSTARAQSVLPKTTNTYELGDSSTPLRWRNLNTHNIRFSNGGTDLSIYEEGTWTPTVYGTSTTGTGTYITNVGRFVRVGKLVLAFFEVSMTGHTGAGDMHLTGLPYAGTNLTGEWSGGTVMIEYANYAGGAALYEAVVDPNEKNLKIVAGLSNAGQVGITLVTTARFRGSVVYTTGMT